MQLRLLSFVVSLSLIACTAQPIENSVKYYLLSPEIVSEKAQASVPMQNWLLKITGFPSYFNQNRLFMKMPGAEIRYANNHYWGEALKLSTYQTLQNYLNIQGASQYLASCKHCPTVLINIQHFYPEAGGLVKLIGRYSIQSNNKGLANWQYFTITVPLEKPGYNHAVLAMRSALQKLANTIQAR